MSNARELSELAGSYGTGGFVGMKNRIINGAMMIDQRNAGGSVTPASGAWTYLLDRWASYVNQSSKLSVQQVSDAPTSFKNSLKVTSLSAYSVISSDIFSIKQSIEGFNFYDFNYGTASAATFTLSFWVKSSLTGTFGGGLQNADGDRGYAFTYTIIAANTWEYKTVVIAGDTSGTWVGAANTQGINVLWGLGVGSNRSIAAGAWGSNAYTNSATGATSVVGTSGATWQITGVQLEKGSTATSFDYRPYGTELALCQRYFETSYPNGTAPGTITSNGIRSASAAAAFVGGTSTRAFMFNATFATQKRVQPNTIVFYDPSASNASGKISGYSSATQYTVSSSSGSGATNLGSYITTTTGTQTEIYQFHFTADSEL